MVVVHVGPVRARGGIAAVVARLTAACSPVVRAELVHTSDFLDGGPVRKLVQFGRAFVAARALARRSSPRVDLAHLHVSTGASLLRKVVLARLFRSAGVPCVCHLHSARLLENRPGRVGRSLLYALVRSSVATIVPLEIWRTKLRQAMPPSMLERITVVPNPVEMGVLRSAPARAPRRFGYYGALMESKGVLDLVDAFGRVAQEHPHAELVLAGNGSRRQRRRLDQGIRRCGAADRVRVLGWLDAEGRRRFLGDIDVFVLFTRSEWFGMSAVEALAEGKRLVLADLPSLREVVGDVPGVTWVPPQGRVEALAAAMTAVARSPQGPPPGGPERFERFAPPAVAEALLRVYENVVRGAAPRHGELQREGVAG